MANKLTRPKSGPEWLRWVESTLADLQSTLRSKVVPPVGAMVVYAGGGTPPIHWLTCAGGTFSSTTYPLLAHRLGSTTLPNPTSVGGQGWIIRAE